MEVLLPSGKGKIGLDISDKNILKIIEAREMLAEEGVMERGIDREALKKFRGKIAIVVDDKTRPCPTKEILPYIIDELNGEIKIIFATGTHEEVNKKEAFELLGNIANEYEWISHSQSSEFVDLGKTKFGTPLLINSEYMKADVKILIGDIEYHYFAGYGGGRKSVLPGVASEKTIEINHQRMFHENARFGVLDGNPVSDDMENAADIAGVDFCFNVVMNSRHEIVGAFSGEHKKVLREGAKMVDKMYKVELSQKADSAIIAADGYPHDINLYQAMKAIQTVVDVVKEGGSIFLVAECSEGHGSKKFYDEIGKYRSSEEVKEDLLRKFIMGKHKIYYMLRACEKFRIYMVTKMSEEMVSHFRMKKIEENEIVDYIYKNHGRDAKVIVSPNASTTLATLKPQ